MTACDTARAELPSIAQDNLSLQTMATDSKATEVARQAGFDPSLNDASLSYSYEKRALQHQAALDLALELERIGRELRGEPQSAD